MNRERTRGSALSVFCVTGGCPGSVTASVIMACTYMVSAKAIRGYGGCKGFLSRQPFHIGNYKKNRLNALKTLTLLAVFC